MFLAFEYGVMYVLSFAMMATVFVSATALAVLLARGVWRLRPQSNSANNRLASACDSRRPIAELGTCQLAGSSWPSVKSPSARLVSAECMRA